MNYLKGPDPLKLRRLAAGFAIVGLVGLMAAPVFAVTDTVSYSQDTSLVLTGVPVTLTILAGSSHGDGLSVFPTYLVLPTVIIGSFTLRYPSPAKAFTDGVTDYCNYVGGNNDFIFTSAYAGKNISISANSCGAPSGGGGGGGGGGGITQPFASLSAPNGGQNLIPGSLYQISWSAGGTNVAATKLSLSTDGGVSYPTVIAASLSGGVIGYSWTVPDTATTQAKIKVEAINSSAAVLATDFSDQVFTIAGTAVPPAEQPVAPGVLDDPKVVVKTTEAQVSWKTQALSGSTVEYGLKAGPPYDKTKSDVTAMTDHFVALTGLTPATEYHYRAISADAAGTKVVSADAVFRTLAADADIKPPAAVSGLTATAGDGQIALAWTNPTDADFAGVKVLRRDGVLPSGPADGTVAYDGKGASLSDSGRTNGTTYYYAVYAYDAVGNLSPASVASATPAAPDLKPPASVTNLKAVAGNAQVMLTWNLPSDSDLNLIKVVRKTGSSPSGPADGTVFKGFGSYFIDTCLTNGTTYHYAVFAYDRIGNYSSAFASATPSASAAALPAPPTTADLTPAERQAPAVDPTTTGVYAPQAAIAATPTINVQLGLVTVPTEPLPVSAGQLVKTADSRAVYFVGRNGYRFVFPTQMIYTSWYGRDFSQVLTISKEKMAKMRLGGNIQFRVGTLIKTPLDSRVFVVTRSKIRWITSEAVALTLGGRDWAKLVHDVDQSFFQNYVIGAPLTMEQIAPDQSGTSTTNQPAGTGTTSSTGGTGTGATSTPATGGQPGTCTAGGANANPQFSEDEAVGIGARG